MTFLITQINKTNEKKTLKIKVIDYNTQAGCAKSHITFYLWRYEYFPIHIPLTNITVRVLLTRKFVFIFFRNKCKMQNINIFEMKLEQINEHKQEDHRIGYE